MAICPICKSTDAYYGIFGWNCISCQNLNKPTIKVSKIEKSYHKYDGGKHWKNKGRPDWGDLLMKNKVSTPKLCKICGESWESKHVAETGECFKSIKEKTEPTYYKYPEE